ncbi:orotidine 5'-phosphate decarboxylase, partial [candidate division KSB1 bacterium]|nr:orotidine 5'-phosphate decarboxylase [candidate division KSB1 bacterium]
IVAADFDPTKKGGREGVYDSVLALAETLKDLPLWIKINAIRRDWGSDITGDLHKLKFSVFADLKLSDIQETMKHDAAFLVKSSPEMITLNCATSSRKALKEFGNTVAGITKVVVQKILESKTWLAW